MTEKRKGFAGWGRGRRRGKSCISPIILPMAHCGIIISNVCIADGSVMILRISCSAMRALSGLPRITWIIINETTGLKWAILQKANDTHLEINQYKQSCKLKEEFSGDFAGAKVDSPGDDLPCRPIQPRFGISPGKMFPLESEMHHLHCWYAHWWHLALSTIYMTPWNCTSKIPFNYC